MELKMDELGLDNPVAVFIEWEIGKTEAANFSDYLLAYVIWKRQNGLEILVNSKLILFLFSI